MSSKKIITLILTNLVLCIIDIICFSPAFIGLSVFSENVFVVASAVTIVVVSILFFIYLNMLILKSEKLDYTYNIEKTNKDDDYIAILNKLKKIKFYSADIIKIIDQIERLQRKEDIFKNILFQKFQDDETNKNIFLDVSIEAHSLFIKNIKSLINLFSIFDEEEYQEFIIKYGEIPKEKMELYQENLDDVHKYINSNENILLNIDKLINETTRFGDSIESSKLDEKSLNKLKDITNSMKELRQS